MCGEYSMGTGNVQINPVLLSITLPLVPGYLKMWSTMPYQFFIPIDFFEIIANI